MNKEIDYAEFDDLKLAERLKAIVRLIIPIAALIFANLGWDFDGEFAWDTFCNAITLVTFVWAWWKNNNITNNAIIAQISKNIIVQNTKNKLDKESKDA